MFIIINIINQYEVFETVPADRDGSKFKEMAPLRVFFSFFQETHKTTVLMEFSSTTSNVIQSGSQLTSLRHFINLHQLSRGKSEDP